MISYQISNTRPMPLAIMSCRVCSDVLRFPKEVLQITSTSCGECCYDEKVLALPGGEAYQNDFSSFIARKLIGVDTIQFRLLKDGFEVAVLNDDTYGEYFASFTEQPLYSGFVVSWEKVLNLLGPGCYSVQTVTNILTVEKTETSHNYRLYPFSDAIADGTVRIETYMNGCVESSDFDFTGLNWYQSSRIEGFFGLVEPEFETDNYQDSTRRKRQIQDSINRTYTLETNDLPSIISNRLVYESLLSNEILVTDYNQLNFERYVQVPVYPSEISKSNKVDQKELLEIKFTDKVPNILKRNFK